MANTKMTPRTEPNKKDRVCSVCKQPNHDRRNCPLRAETTIERTEEETTSARSGSLRIRLTVPLRGDSAEGREEEEGRASCSGVPVNDDNEDDSWTVHSEEDEEDDNRVEGVYDKLAVIEDCDSSDEEGAEDDSNGEDDEEYRKQDEPQETEGTAGPSSGNDDGAAKGHWFAFDFNECNSSPMEEAMEEIRKTWNPDDKRKAGECGFTRDVLQAVKSSTTPCLEALRWTGLMCPKFMKRVVTCTNYYLDRGGKVGRAQKEKFSGMDNKQYYRFIYALLYMCTARLPSLRMYWERDIFRQDGLFTVISYDVFRVILSSFHVEYVDSGAGCSEENKQKTKKDPAWRVRWIFDHFNKLWLKCVVVHCFLSLDEAIIPSKVRHALLQYIKGKPHKFGFKLYVLADPSLKFCIRVVLHDGQETKKHEIINRVVPLSLRIPGLCLVMDNFYWTIQSMLMVRCDWKMNFIGTLKKNAIGKDVNWVVKQNKRSRGNMMGVEYVDEGGVHTGIKALSVSDKRVVTLVSTLPVSKITVERRESKRVHSGQPKQTRLIQQPLPSTIPIYNKTMGAVDLVGFFMTLLRFDFRQKKWTLKVLFGLMSISMANAHKIYNVATGRKVSLNDFVRLTMKELYNEIMKSNGRSLASSSSSSSSRRSSSTRLEITPFFPNRVAISPVRRYERLFVQESVRLDGNQHFPFRRAGTSHRCYVCKDRRMQFWCAKCNVPLCIDFVGTEETPELSDTCWFVHHMRLVSQDSKAYEAE